MNFFLGNRKLVKADEDSAATGLEGLADAVDSGMSASDVSKSLLSTAPQAAGQLMAKLENDISDANVLVLSDSTGDSYYEWVGQYADWIASEYPAFTVNYYAWDDDNGVYAAAVQVQAGTGSNILSIYNAAVHGTKISYLMGDKYTNAVQALPECDLVMINHGHNHMSFYNSDTTYWVKDAQYLEAVAQVMKRHGGAGVIMLTQNPRRDDDLYYRQYESIVRVAGMIGADVADSYSLFESEGRPSDWYLDNVHPTGDGIAAYLTAVESTHSSKIGKSSLDFINTSKVNLLSNGDFAALTGEMPDDWLTGGDVVVSKNTDQRDSAKDYSIQLTVGTDSASANFIKQTLGTGAVDALAGSYVTLAARVYVGAGNGDAAGVIALSSNSNSQTYEYSINDQRDGWHWRMLTTYIPVGANYAQVRLYPNPTGNTGDSALFDRVVLCKGRLPSDI